MSFGRRKFLTLATGTLAGYGLLRAFSRDGSAAPKDEIKSDKQRVERRSYALGSEVSIIALHSDRAVAEKAVQACFDELELIENVMSIYRPESQISLLNKDGEIAMPHPYLVEVLRAAQSVSKASGGAFDITVQPLWELYTRAKAEKRLPNAGEVSYAKTRVDWRNLEISADKVRFSKPQTAITLNGIAQGYATDRVSALLKKHDIKDALINSGEIGSLGVNAKGEAWRVGVQNPRQVDAFSAVVALDGRCLSTSGDYATTFSDDFAHNHIFDPATGDSPTEFASVSVLADTGALADALSTAVFVCGKDKGLALLKQQRADAYLIGKDGAVVATPGFPKVS